MLLFYAPDIAGKEYTLGQEESKHCIKVLRLQKGNGVSLTDGKGNLFTAVIAEDNPKQCRLEVLRRIPHYGKRDYSVEIAIAPVKNPARFEWFLEKATETGIDRILPFTSAQSERDKINRERSEKIMIAAMKQSIRAYLPVLDEMKKLLDIVQSPFDGMKFIAHASGQETPHLKDVCMKGTKVLVLIGPEGDFTRQEVDEAENNGFKQINLGPNRLRTETAALTACCIINLLNQ
ncbi:MAG: 16S rRNA (uracil(1498)-N(3))-methyltransferase [Bacteroidales bacterium]|nr:16S rRNA (uracil(1498)-N(3))-methyltransferase [Bacteroidales bacterium]